jgi:hypothetical protein
VEVAEIPITVLGRALRCGRRQPVSPAKRRGHALRVRRAIAAEAAAGRRLSGSRVAPRVVVEARVKDGNRRASLTTAWHDATHDRPSRRRLAVSDDINVLALVKGSERYVFLYDDASRAETLRVLGRYASNSDLSFTWYDAAVLSQKIRQESQKLAMSNRFDLPLTSDKDDIL